MTRHGVQIKGRFSDAYSAVTLPLEKTLKNNFEADQNTKYTWDNATKNHYLRPLQNSQIRSLKKEGPCVVITYMCY